MASHDDLEKCIQAVDTGLVALSSAMREMPDTVAGRRAVVTGPLVGYLIAHAQLVTMISQLGRLSSAYDPEPQ